MKEVIMVMIVEGCETVIPSFISPGISFFFFLLTVPPQLALHGPCSSWFFSPSPSCYLSSLLRSLRLAHLLFPLHCYTSNNNSSPYLLLSSFTFHCSLPILFHAASNPSRPSYPPHKSHPRAPFPSATMQAWKAREITHFQHKTFLKYFLSGSQLLPGMSFGAGVSSGQ